MNLIKKPYGFEAFQASPGRVWIYISMKDPLAKTIIPGNFNPSLEEDGNTTELVVFSSGIDYIPVGSIIRLGEEYRDLEKVTIQMHPKVLKELKARTELAKSAKKSETHDEPLLPLEGFLSVEAYEIDGYQLPQDVSNTIS